jgi:hypothetical protein
MQKVMITILLMGSGMGQAYGMNDKEIVKIPKEIIVIPDDTYNTNRASGGASPDFRDPKNLANAARELDSVLRKNTNGFTVAAQKDIKRTILILEQTALKMKIGGAKEASSNSSDNKVVDSDNKKDVVEISDDEEKNRDGEIMTISSDSDENN